MPTTTTTTPPSANAGPKRPARGSHAAASRLCELDARDLAPRRPAAFFGLSAHASDRAARATRGVLAYQPI